MLGICFQANTAPLLYKVPSNSKNRRYLKIIRIRGARGRPWPPQILPEQKRGQKQRETICYCWLPIPQICGSSATPENNVFSVRIGIQLCSFPISSLIDMVASRYVLGKAKMRPMSRLCRLQIQTGRYIQVSYFQKMYFFYRSGSNILQQNSTKQSPFYSAPSIFAVLRNLV